MALSLTLVAGLFFCAWARPSMALEAGLADDNQFPYHVSVQRRAEWRGDGVDLVASSCGGSVLDARTVVTSATCCLSVVGVVDEGHFHADTSATFVLAGSNSLSAGDDDDDAQLIGVDRIMPHQYFGHDVGAAIADNDVCLVKLSEPLFFDESVRAVAPAAGRLDGIPGTLAHCRVAGWGDGVRADGEDGAVADDYLRFAEVELLRDPDCEAALGSEDYKADRMVCARLASLVDGDDDVRDVGPGCIFGKVGGGGLVCQDEVGSEVLVGVAAGAARRTRASDGCFSAAGPFVYADVRSYAPWILSGGAVHDDYDEYCDGCTIIVEPDDDDVDAFSSDGGARVAASAATSVGAAAAAAVLAILR